MSENNAISLYHTLFNLFKKAISVAYPDVCDPPVIIISNSNERFGDYQCNSAMALSKQLKNDGKIITISIHYQHEILVAGIGVYMFLYLFRNYSKAKRCCREHRVQSRRLKLNLQVGSCWSRFYKYIFEKGICTKDLKHFSEKWEDVTTIYKKAKSDCRFF